VKRTALAVIALAAAIGTPALADTHYMLCFGGGRAALYWSNVFAVPETTKSDASALAFNAFVKARYGTMIHSECHRNGAQAIADADKKTRQGADQGSKFPSKIVETGWTGH
jgi:hypothetical protein